MPPAIVTAFTNGDSTAITYKHVTGFPVLAGWEITQPFRLNAATTMRGPEAGEYAHPEGDFNVSNITNHDM